MRGSGRVNASTLGMEIDVPLGGYSGRGVGVPVSLSYSSKLWRLEAYFKYPLNGEENYRTLTKAKYAENSASGWSVSTAAPYIEYTGEQDLYDVFGNPVCLICIEDPGPGGNSNTVIRRLTFHGADGGSNELRPTDPSRGIDRTNIVYDWLGTFYAVDGSKLRYTETATTFTMQMPDGSFYKFGARETRGSRDAVRRAISYTDSNGNTIYYHAANSTFPNGYITDTMGRNISSVIPADAPTTPVVEEHTMPGMAAPYKFHWKKLKDTTEAESALADFSEVLHHTGSGNCNFPNVQATTPSLFTGFEGQVWVCSQHITMPFNPVLLTEIELPNGQSYRFTYNVFGEIEEIYYPTGSKERFEYEKVPPFSPAYSVYDQVNRGVKKRQVFETPASGTPIEWTYAVTNWPASAYYTVTATNPDGTKNQRFLQFSPPDLESDKFGYSSTLDGMAYEERTLNASGQVITRKVTKWEETVEPWGYVTLIRRHPRVISEASFIYEPGSASGLASSVAYEYDGDANAVDWPMNVKTISKTGFEVVNGTPPNPGTAYIPSSNVINVTEMDYLSETNYTARNITGLVSETRVKDAAGNVKAKSQITYDGLSLLSEPTSTRWENPNTNYRGLVTKTRSWHDIANNLYIDTQAQYDMMGNLRYSWDGNGSLSQVEYSSTYDHAYPTKTVSPDPDGAGAITPLETTVVYDYNTGLPTSTTDANGQTTQMEYNDPLLRPTKTIAPNGHQTITEYGAGTSELTRFVKSRSQIDETNWKEAYSWFDGLGRAYKSQSVDSAGDVFTESLFDEFGRPWKSSNPYRTGETKLWTENFYDTAGRVWKVKTPDGADVETAYGLATTGSQIGTVVTVTDQAEKQRRSITNSLGQLTRVDEPNNAGQLGTVSTPNQPTLYTYDTLNNLTQVQQIGVNAEQCGGAPNCSQMRSFVYDSRSRLKSATNPESGLIQYSYDLNGNLTTKIDARTITTTYAYDALNRVKTRAYTNEPSGSETADVTYTYDDPLIANSKGKLTKVSSSISETKYSSFDILGRVLSSQQITDGQTYPSSYTYNLGGALIEQTYPSGRVVKNVLDNNGDLSIVQSKKSSNHGFWNYAENFTFSAARAVTSLQLGNGRWESTQFNSRLQPTQIALGTVQNGTDKMDLDFGYGTTANNGNVISQTITVPTVGANNGFTATQSYTYDSLNRISQATENITGVTPPSWKQTFTYDRYGNRNFDQANTTQPASFAYPDVTNPTISTTNNRFASGQGYSYDLSGNTTQDALGRTFVYDAENKQIEVIENTVTIGEYFYDGDGKRVKKVVPNGETVIFVYDAGGKLVAEYANQISQTPKVSYLTNDHLGSPRINTDENGSVIARHDYHPFGEEIIGIGGRTIGLGYAADDVRKQFTGYERDSETNLDFAQARYFNSGFGRFSSPDSFTNDTSKTDPQSWNLYAYVRNNPTNISDPSGKKGEIKWWTDDDGVIQVRFKAKFAFYGAKGHNLSKKDIKAFKTAVIEGIKKHLSKEFSVDGKSFNVQAKVSGVVKEDERSAIKSGADNIVELGNQTLRDNEDDSHAGAMAFGVKGENFDRMVLDITGDTSGLIEDTLFEQAGKSGAHEFGAHLLSGGHSDDTRSVFGPYTEGGSEFQDRDFMRLFLEYEVSGPPPPPPPNNPSWRPPNPTDGLARSGSRNEWANNRNSETATDMYRWERRMKN